MFEKILIPYIADCDIEESIPATGIGCKKGDVFLFNPDNEFHVALYDSHCFIEIPNKECKFICDVPKLSFGDKECKDGEEVDITDIPENVVKNLVSIGYLKKVYNKKDSKKTESKKAKTKKVATITYSQFAKKLGFTSKEFKTSLEMHNITIPDMRKNIPTSQQKKIKKLLQEK